VKERGSGRFSDLRDEVRNLTSNASDDAERSKRWSDLGGKTT
jgi:hypothetical protein